MTNPHPFLVGILKPSAKDALQDPWLQGNSLERNQGKPLDATVIQRIQVGHLLFQQANVITGE